MNCITPGFLSCTISWSLPKLMAIESMMPSNHLILCHPLFLLHWTFPSLRVFSNESALHIRWPKYWSFIFSISLSSEYSGLISFMIDCFDLLAVQGLSRVFSNTSLKTSISWCSALSMVLGWPWEGQSSPRVARESWGLRSSHCRAEETSPRRVSGT